VSFSSPHDVNRYLSALSEAWAYSPEKLKGPSKAWPPVQPEEEAIEGLRTALKACNASTDGNCETIQFDLGSALLGLAWDSKAEHEGASLYLDLATRGHGDGMVGWGICLADGRAVDRASGKSGFQDEQQACQWWKAAAKLKHPQAAFELGSASYTGAGTEESEAAAFGYFSDAVEWSGPSGHPAALYMLGDCLLEGIGVPQRDGARALDLFKRSGELGHRGARSRLLALLAQAPAAKGRQQAEADGKFTDASRQSLVRITGNTVASPMALDDTKPNKGNLEGDEAEDELSRFERAIDNQWTADVRRLSRRAPDVIVHFDK
jgi:TPR repeat protein